MAATAVFALAAGTPLCAQDDASAREAAALDITGEWVSVITEDWKFRMVTPDRGEYGGIPLNAAARRAADAWDPGADEAAGAVCKAYGAPAIMRVPGRLRIGWHDASTLRIDTDAGSQTRLLRFGAAGAGAERSWQGHSAAEWRHAADVGEAPESDPASTGTLKVVTTNLRGGYLRKNGVPYSEDAVVTEYFNRIRAPNGDEWLIVTTEVDDPTYLSRPYVTSAHFKQLDAGDDGWSPTPCTAR